MQRTTRGQCYLAFCAARVEPGDWSDIDIALRRSTDDGAKVWSDPTFDEALFEPVCCGSLIRISSSPSMLLFVNPDSRHREPNRTGKASYPRENLSAKLSYDEGTTWPVARVIDPGVTGYSDLAVAADGSIYCLYEHGGQMARNKFVSIVHFDLSWLKDAE